MRAYVYPRLDTAVWMSDASAPAPARVIGFDPDAGSLVYVDGKGVPRRADLRVGGVTAATGPKLRLVDLVSSDGSAIFGLSLTGGVIRVTPSGETWTFSPAAGARGVFPQRDGAVVVLGGPETHPMLWRVRPPGSGGTLRTPNLSVPLEALVRALRDAEVLVQGNVPAAFVRNRHEVNRQ